MRVKSIYYKPFERLMEELKAAKEEADEITLYLEPLFK